MIPSNCDLTDGCTVKGTRQTVTQVPALADFCGYKVNQKPVLIF